MSIIRLRRVRSFCGRMPIGIGIYCPQRWAMSYSTFEITSDKAFVYFKPCLRREADFKWSVGANYLLLLDTDVEQSVYPRFFSSDRGSFSELIEAPSQYYDQAHKVRVFLPPGYQENTLKHYPVLYMHDGNNLFLPQEASFGETWEVAANLDLLDSLRTVREVIVVGVWPLDRMAEYTQPAYSDYGKFLVEELKPFIDRRVSNAAGPAELRGDGLLVGRGRVLLSWLGISAGVWNGSLPVQHLWVQG